MKRTQMKRKTVRRDWSGAEVKRGPCRVCGHPYAELAHTIGRKHDPLMVGPRGGEYRYVNPDSVIPLCNGCHTAFDERRLDILSYLDLEEQLNAVETAGGIYLALVRLCPGEYGRSANA